MYGFSFIWFLPSTKLVLEFMSQVVHLFITKVDCSLQEKRLFSTVKIWSKIAIFDRLRSKIVIFDRKNAVEYKLVEIKKPVENIYFRPDTVEINFDHIWSKI